MKIIKSNTPSGVNQRLPWKYSGCVGAWHCESVTESGGKVTQWDDLSGNGRHLTQSDVSRQGVKTSLGVEAAFAYDITGGIPLDFQSHSVVLICRPSDVTEKISQTGMVYQCGTGPGLYFNAINAFLYGPTRYAPPLAMPQFGVASFVIASGTSETVTYSNSTRSTTVATTAGTGTLSKIIGDDSGGTLGDNSPKFPIIAALVFNRKLTNTEVLEINAHFGVSNDTGGDLLIVDGNSVTNGYLLTAATKGFIRVAATELGARLSLDGVNGRKFSTVVASSAASLMIKSPSRRNIWVVYPGGNDLADNGTAVALQGDITTYCSRIRASNPFAKIILSTLLPRSATASGYTNGQTAAGFETARGDVNTWVRANVATIADGLADFAANAAFDAQADADNTTYFNADKTHPNDAGHALMAQILVAAIRKLQ